MLVAQVHRILPEVLTCKPSFWHLSWPLGNRGVRRVWITVQGRWRWRRLGRDISP